MSIIRFTSKVFKIGSTIVLKIPKEASQKFPSRGLVVVEGTINGFHFQDALEPDGKKGHWLMIDKKLFESAKLKIDKKVELVIETTDDWPEPEIPLDLKNAFAKSKEAYKVWIDITPKSRWDWIRWIRSTKNPETRKKRIEVTFSKFKAGKRRPCCFNYAECTVPEVSNKGTLLGL